MEWTGPVKPGAGGSNMAQFISVPAIALILWAGIFSLQGGEAESFFESRIRPLLVERCQDCHGSGKSENGLRLDSSEALLRGGHRGPGVLAGEPEKSLIIRAVRRTDRDLQMPPKSPLSAEEVALLEKWVRDGAVWPAGLEPVENRKSPMEEATRHWSFQPVAQVTPPQVQDASRAQRPLDLFLIQQLEAHGLHWEQEADRATWIRRVTFNATGLPPTPEEIGDFLDDSSPRAHERVVDRLLASDAYGEKWGRHWLDLARYADTAGDTSDYPIPEMYLYRDYVVDAFNEDLPYDEFLREQLAGDILADRDPGHPRYEQRIVATGFLALSPQFGPQLRQHPHLIIENTIQTVGEGLMGLTLGCARCHDHKFEPISTRDYYGLYGYFSSTVYPHAGSEEAPQPGGLQPLVRDPELRRSYIAYSEQNAELGNKILLARRGRKLPHSLQEYRDMFKELQEKRPQVLQAAFAVRDKDKPADAKIQLRGEPSRLGEIVPRGFLQILAPDQSPDLKDAGSGRLALADWIVSPKHPLTARVIVNRIWYYHFRKGLVPTLSDFGLQGEPPTHPELLDYLAGELVRNGWSIKKLQREILLSGIYRLASLPEEINHEKDPDNRWYWRFDRRRLDGEEIRDAMLAVSGNLDASPGGSHEFVPVSQWGEGVHYTQHRPFHDVYESSKRSIYLMTQRLHEHPLLGLFDPPDRSVSTPSRRASTVPLQSLFLMNGPFLEKQARSMAERILQAGSNDQERLDFAHQLAWGQQPDEATRQQALDYLQAVQERLGHPDPVAAWSSYARVLLSGNPFHYVD